jgi:hypothetical protein
LVAELATTEVIGEDGDEQAVLDLVLPRAQARIDSQLGDSTALDSKALGVLGIDAAAIALMVAARDEFSGWWALPAFALGAAGVLLLAAVWPRELDAGPDPRSFYEAMATGTRLEATRKMLAELLAAAEANRGPVTGKRRLFKAGFALLVAALLGALAVALAG